MAQENRTLPPTKRKLDKARERGEVARYRDLVCLAGMLAGGAAALWLLPGEARRVAALARDAFAGQPGAEGLAPSAAASLAAAGIAALRASLVVAAPAAAAVLLAGLLSTRFLFTPKPVAPQLARVSPLQGLKGVFSGERFAGIVKDAVKMLVVGLAGWLAFKGALPLFASIPAAGSAGGAWRLLRGLFFLVFECTAACLAAITLLDVLTTRRFYMKRMMMTHEELKRELKESEGDPLVKGRRRRLHGEIAFQRMLEDVKRATVVIANPDHVAVALRWKEGETQAPAVVATGRDHLALRIVAEARRHGVPVVRDVRLARSLAELEPGEEIPEGLYEAVAGVIRLLE